MAAKIGILGESTSVTSGSNQTVYTVPADKAARVRLLFAFEGGSASTYYLISPGNPGANDFMIVRKTVNDGDVFSGMTGTGSIASNIIGLVDAGAGTLDINNWNIDEIVAYWPHDFWLSTGDIVRFHIGGGDAADHQFHVGGVEDDA